MFDHRIAQVFVASLLAAGACTGDTDVVPPGVDHVAAATGDSDVAPSGVGHLATAEEVAGASITIFPGGSGLPPGKGSVAQGRGLYRRLCAGCHGVRGEGSDYYPALAGGRGSLASNAPVLTVGSYWPYATTVWDYIRRAMPYPRPGTLTPDQVYALTAYLLHLNGIVGAHATLDEKNLPRIRMPNREGFIHDPRPDFH